MKTTHSFVANDHRAVPALLSVLTDALAGFPQYADARMAAARGATPAPAAAQGPGFRARLDQWFHQARMNDDEAYLAGAVDAQDLEQRMRQLEQGISRRYYY